MSSRTPAVGASESLSFAQTALSSGPVPSETRAEPSSLPDQDIDIEPLTVSDLQQMRGRLEQLGLIGSDESKQSTLSSIEKELVDMVRKLLTVRPVVDTSQLLSQAEVIAALSQKCANVVEEMSEVRQRWAVERRGWERSSEALIIQRNSAREGIMDEVSPYVLNLFSPPALFEDILCSNAFPLFDSSERVGLEGSEVLSSCALRAHSEEPSFFDS
ncbi:hypothetical protein C8Q75DRAFT_886132 [Abortiporus biennis]|nr:hypothetical protein C8Q75DRAFT_886132 [Abortiporus biennis]